MDSGMAANVLMAHDSALEQATGGVNGGGAGDPASGDPAPTWLRVRASGFGHGMPALLIEALRACAASGGRIEMGPWASGSAEPSPADLHLVAIQGADAAASALAALDDGAGRRLAVCIDTDAATSLCAIAAGADGVLYLHDGPEDLARALRAAASGMPALTATAARALVAHARATCQAPADTPSGATVNEAPATTIRLTAREREIIGLADQGCTFTQAARLLGVQVSTVYTHVRRLYEKLSVNSLPQALHEARRLGLL